MRWIITFVDTLRGGGVQRVQCVVFGIILEGDAEGRREGGTETERHEDYKLYLFFIVLSWKNWFLSPGLLNLTLPLNQKYGLKMSSYSVLDNAQRYARNTLLRRNASVHTDENRTRYFRCPLPLLPVHNRGILIVIVIKILLISVLNLKYNLTTVSAIIIG